MGNVSLNVLEKSLNFLCKNENEPCYLDTFFDEYVVSVNGFHPPGGGTQRSATFHTGRLRLEIQPLTLL